MGSLMKEDDSCNLIHMTKLSVFNEERHIRNSGLICTIGPASRQVKLVVCVGFSSGTEYVMDCGVDILA